MPNHPPHLRLLSHNKGRVDATPHEQQRVRIGDRALNLHAIEALEPLAGVAQLLWQQPFLHTETFDRLLTWMAREDAISLQVVVGEPLAGKSRMAAELCKRVSDQWCCGFWQSDGGQKGKDRPLSVQMDRPTLIVVDEAPEQAEALGGWLCALARHPDQVPHRLRVLFLADHGDPTWGWWRDLLESAGRARLHLSQFFDYSHGATLTSFLAKPSHRFQFLKSLLAHYNPNLSLGSYRTGLPWINALAHRDWCEDPLYLWMVAFVVAHTPNNDDTLLETLLAPEPLAVERAMGAMLGLQVQRQMEGEWATALLPMVLFNTLCHGLDAQTLSQQMAPLALDLGVDGDRLRMLAQRLRYGVQDYYAWPIAGDGGIPPLGPEPLAVAFISTHLLELPLPLQQQLLVATTAVGGKWPLLQLIHCLHGESDDHRFNQLVQRIEERILDDRLPLNDLMDLVDSMPSGFGPVSELEQTILNHLVERLDAVVQGVVSHAYYPALGHYCNMLSYVLSYLQRFEQALTFAQRSVHIFEALVEEAADIFEPDLADALSSCGLRLEELEQIEQAVEMKEQARLLFESLALRDAETFTASWARALNSLGVSLGTLQDHSGAIQSCTQSLSLFERLAKIHPRQFAGDYAAALNNTSNVLKEAGQLKEALQWVSKAADVFDGLYKRDPQLHGANVVKAHSNRTFLLAELGHDDEALAEGNRALTLTREMMEREPELYRPFMAELCEQFSKPLQRLGQHELSSTLLQEAVSLYRELAAQEPLYYEERLAAAIYQLADSNFERGDQTLALQSVSEAVALFERLAQRQPREFNPLLVMALHNQSVGLANQGQIHQAIRAMRRTVGLYGVLELGDEEYLPAHVQALDSLGLFLRDAGRSREAAKVCGEAMVQLLSGYAQLQEQELDRIAPQVCRNRWLLCQEVGNRAGALEALQNLRDILMRQVVRNQEVDDAAALLESWEAQIKSLVEDNRMEQAEQLVTQGQMWFAAQQQQPGAVKLRSLWVIALGRMALIRAQLLVAGGAKDEAMASAALGLQLIDGLYESDHMAFGANMGQGYCEASDCARHLDLPQQALSYRQAAVKVFEKLVLAGQQHFMPTLATERLNVATLLGREDERLEEACGELTKTLLLWPQCAGQQPQTLEPLWVRTLELLAMVQHRLGDHAGRYETLTELVEQLQKMQYVENHQQLSARMTLAECLLERFESQPELDAAQRLGALQRVLSPLQGRTVEPHGVKLGELLARMAEMAFEVDDFKQSESLALWGESLFQGHVEPLLELRLYVRRARNFQRLAQYLVQEKQYSRALNMAQKAVEICVPLLKQEGDLQVIRPFVAVNHHQYAVCLMLVGQYGAVEPIAKQALMLMYEAFLEQPESLHQGLLSLLHSYENLLLRSQGMPLEKVRSQTWILPVYAALEQHKPRPSSWAKRMWQRLFGRFSHP
ncbi:TPR repeat-containing protein [Magnetococcus marinus MC-1]|uniref:TPR repeat-containing protein n=1 Tax=Magnetococcus marinus (strain ATCC BAA-1437 / JCM 17883 / MC-1) TaxID=156889 RepID=A0L7F3_MAGMM|nr:hypothetical protein [Magnetococcus marinus]ABK43896.1 TPR repeat-containing protein [Magnetococcus marinus MC-1]